MLRRIITILDRYTTNIENNVRYGNYPFMTMYEDKLRMFVFRNINSVELTLAGWLLPVGIPFMMRYDSGGEEDEYGDRKDRARVIGYYLGNAIYIHKFLFDKFLDNEKKVLFSPVMDEYITIQPPEWNSDERKGFAKYLWQLASKSLGADFRKLANINFDSAIAIDSDILYKDGWVVNRLAGRNVFFGTVKCPIDIMDISVELDGKYLWYNNYLVILDVSGGDGIQVFGNATYGEYPHPHITGGGSLCRGNAVRMIQDKLKTGRITEFFLFMKDFLNSYSDDNPFIHLPVNSNNDDVVLKGSVSLTNKIYSGDVIYEDED